MESVKTTLKEKKVSLLLRLDGEILGGLKEEQEICNKTERSSDMRLNIQETEDIKLQISRSMPISHELDDNELSAALLKEIESREICSFMNYSRKDNEYSGSREPNTFTAAALFSGTGDSNQSRQRFIIKCSYC